MKYRKLIVKLLAVGSFSAVIFTLPAFALPAVESRSQQNASRMQNDNPNFQGESYISANEPLIPPTTSVAQNRVPAGIAATAEDRAALLTLKEVESLQREVSELRGIIEVQDHEIKQLKKSQQDFYLDLDRRLSQLQTKPQSSAKETKSKNNAPTSESLKTKAPSKTASSAASSAVAATSSAASSSEAKSKSLEQTSKPAAKSTEGDALKKNTKASNTTLEEQSSQASNSSDENSAYQAAYNLVKTKQYADATSAFQRYLTQFPEGEHVANAHYWLGEVYMVQWQSEKNNTVLLDKAQNSFSNIAKKFPNHTKTADAALKLGLIELDKGNQDKGREYLMEVKSRYPGTTAARVADSRLQQLQ